MLGSLRRHRGAPGGRAVRAEWARRPRLARGLGAAYGSGGLKGEVGAGGKAAGGKTWEESRASPCRALWPSYTYPEGSREPWKGLSKGVTCSALNCWKTTQQSHAEWAGGEIRGPCSHPGDEAQKRGPERQQCPPTWAQQSSLGFHLVRVAKLTSALQLKAIALTAEELAAA